MKKFLLIGFGLFILHLFINPAAVLAATPAVTVLTPASVTVGRYQKFEAVFSLSKTYPAGSLLPYYFYDPGDTPALYPNRTSPYGVDGISVDAHFTSPSGKSLTVPAFYNQDFTRTGSYSAGETMTPSPVYNWKVRFAPEEAGNYTWFLTIADREGTTRYPVTGSLSFVSNASASKGFIRGSARDPRFLDFSAGIGFVPISSGRQWWLCCGKRSFDYEQAFTEFSKYGINLTRIWDQNDGYALTLEGHFDAYGYPDDYNPDGRIDLTAIPKGTQINQRGASEEDKIIESAEKNGVYLQLTSHEDPYWIWDASVHNESWNPVPVNFTDTQHLNYWKRNFRYRVARWGYSTAVLAWETWNEHGHVLPGTDIYNFYQQYGQYQTAVDPFRHLRTTSQGSQAFSPAFWSSPAFDMANYHNYMMGWLTDDLKNDEANFVYKTAWCLQPPSPTTVCQYLGLGDGTAWSGTVKPWIWGEIDVGTSNWNEVNPYAQNGEGRLRELHNTMWAGLFSPLGTTPIDWYWSTEDTATINAKYTQKKAASAFFADIDYPGSRFTYLMTPVDAPNGYTGVTVPITDPGARAYVMLKGDKTGAYVWIQNKKHTWNTAAAVPAPVSPAVTVNGLVNGTYTVSVWNTYTGRINSSDTRIVTAGSLTVTAPNLTDDVAVKIIPAATGLPAATPFPPSVTPVATATMAPSATAIPVPSASPVNGDVNGDGKVDMSDVTSLLSGWGTFTPLRDQYPDNQINSLDFLAEKNRLAALANSPTSVPVAVDTLKPVPTLIPTPVPTGTVISSPGSDWTQFGHDPQHTDYTDQTVTTPWKYAWQWNGAGPDGKKQAGHLAVPGLVQPVTGGGRVYMIAANAVYALDKNSGSVIWTRGNIGALNSTPVYDQENLYVASGNSTVYKLSAVTGSVASAFTADSALNLAPVLAGNSLYVAADSGSLYSLDKGALAKNWNYTAGSPAVTAPAYSAAKNLVVFVTRDLYVHAVGATDGALKWRVKPTARNYTVADPSTNLTEAVSGWPVIADQHGLVFIRYRLEWQTLWDGPYPTTNAAIRSFLTANPQKQALFALNLDTGGTAFVPAVGNGGQGDGGNLPMGPQPVVRTVGGREVAYIIWRNQLTCIATSWCDGREDATMGEMVLDTATVPGYQPGDVRFVQFADIQTDEMMNLTMSGSTIFHNHWLVAEAQTITDRSAGVGDTFVNPIKTTPAPYIIWRQVYCPATNSSCNPVIYPGGSGTSYGPSDCLFNAASRYCSAGLYSYGDSRAYPAGFYEYFNDDNSGSTPFTVVSGNLVLVKTVDGGLMALQSGSPLGLSSPTVTANAVPATQVLGTAVTVPALIGPADAMSHLNQSVTVGGTVSSGQSHLPKAVYLSLTDGRGTSLLIRIFAGNLAKFGYDPLSLVGKKVDISGMVTLYWPENRDPEIIVTDPSQIAIH